ncbi:hypothetical protein [Streptomyces sp. NPDC048669]|uniref:hypothetical protein n=1 Tax=Streptomyces sp. NPDC048669 TaxID=3155267 RepID=UPI0034156F1C
MTDTPMTPDRERMIRIWHEELARLTDRTAVARHEALGDLLAEVDRLRARPAVYQAVLAPDSGKVRTGRTYSTPAAAQADCEADQRTAPLVDGVRFDWFLYPAPASGSRRWQLHLYEPGGTIPTISDYMVREVPVLDQAADLAGREAMRAGHPAPCRVPDSPDCTCPSEPTLSLCGKTVATNGNVYAPCARHAGHSAAYCRDSTHNHYFLAADTSGPTP